MHALLESYKVLVDFLGKALGPDYEIVLHDLSGENDAVVAIANGQISGRSLGAPLTKLALRFLADREYEAVDYKVGYKGVSQKKTRLRSSTMFIKDEAGAVVGMLCINFDPTHCVQAANGILAACGLESLALEDVLCTGQGSESPGEETEHFVQSMADMVETTIEEVTGETGIAPERLTMDEKVEIVTALQNNGLFLMKGAVSEVANQLSISEASVYRYLSKLKK